MIAIIDYGVGNLRSIANALDFVGVKHVITRERSALRAANHFILPGVGAFGPAMDMLKASSLTDDLAEQVLNRRKPLLGICLGMQLLAKSSNEDGTHRGLGWIDAEVVRLRSDLPGVRVPHIGWNETRVSQEGRLFFDLPPSADFYYVHSYRLVCPPDLIAAEFEHGERVVAAIEHENVFGTQFHPEKSQDAGISVLRNFSRTLSPC